MATHRYVVEDQFQMSYSAVPSPPLLAIALYPSFLLMKLVGLTTSADSISEFASATFIRPSKVVDSLYRLRFYNEFTLQRRRQAALASVVSFLVTLLFPALRSSSLLDSPLYSWALLAVVVFCGRYLIDPPVDSVVASLDHRHRRKKRWEYYSSRVGQFLPSVLHSTLILLTWYTSHFSTGSHLVTRYGMWVLCAWLFRCTLILVHAMVVARSQAKGLYDRFEGRILRAGFQIHIIQKFLPSLGDLNMTSIVVPWLKEGGPEIVQVGADGPCKVEDYIRYLSGYDVTTIDLECMANFAEGYTMAQPPVLAEVFLREVVILVAAMDPHVHGDVYSKIDKRWLRENLGFSDEEACVLYGELCALAMYPDEVCFHTFFTWMEEAYKDNQAVGRTLREEEQTIIDSDRRLMALLINEVFLLWVFFTGNTIAQVFAVIPLVYFAKLFVGQLFKPHFRFLIS